MADRPFFRVECCWWEHIVGQLSKPWPLEAAMTDLRFWANETARGHRMPGRRAMASRWGWTQWQVRSLLRDESKWRDPFRPLSAHSPPSSSPVGNGSTDYIDEIPPTGRPLAAQKPPSRDLISRTSKQLTSTSMSPRRAKRRPCDDPEVVRVWDALRAHLKAPEAWKLTDTRAKTIRQRIKDHGADTLVDLGAWLKSSNHERAVYLRDRSDIETPLRKSKCETYLALMKQDQTATKNDNLHKRVQRRARELLRSGAAESLPECADIAKAEYGVADTTIGDFDVF